MVRKLFWVLALLALVGSVTTLSDRRQADRRRELWTEATDPR